LTVSRYTCEKTVKNQITLLKTIVEKLPKTDYFEVSLRGEEIVLRPVVIEGQNTKLERVRSKMKALGLAEQGEFVLSRNIKLIKEVSATSGHLSRNRV
jgi:hypothetical protein